MHCIVLQRDYVAAVFIGLHYTSVTRALQDSRPSSIRVRACNGVLLFMYIYLCLACARPQSTFATRFTQPFNATQC